MIYRDIYLPIHVSYIYQPKCLVHLHNGILCISLNCCSFGTWKVYKNSSYLHIYNALQFTNSILPHDASSNSEICHYHHSVNSKTESQEPRDFSKKFDVSIIMYIKSLLKYNCSSIHPPNYKFVLKIQIQISKIILIYTF